MSLYLSKTDLITRFICLIAQNNDVYCRYLKKPNTYSTHYNALQLIIESSLKMKNKTVL